MDDDPWLPTDVDEGRPCSACGAMDMDTTACEFCGTVYAECFTCGWVSDPEHR